MAHDPVALRLELLYFTDPLCSWCWATEPNLRRLKEEYGHALTITTKMGGLLQSWDNFYDEAAGIRRPADVAPHWAEVSQATGMPIDERLWLEDPPNSSFPASIAFKAAELQSPDLAERYLRRLREAVLTERKNIAKLEVLVALAQEVGLDLPRFGAALQAREATKAFVTEVREARDRGIFSFPTMVFRGPGGDAILAGYRAYPFLEQAMGKVSKGPIPKKRPPPLEEFVQKYRRVLPREVAEVYNIPLTEATKQLESTVVVGRARRAEVRNGVFYEAV